MSELLELIENLHKKSKKLKCFDCKISWNDGENVLENVRLEDAVTLLRIQKTNLLQHQLTEDVKMLDAMKALENRVKVVESENALLISQHNEKANAETQTNETIVFENNIIEDSELLDGFYENIETLMAAESETHRSKPKLTDINNKNTESSAKLSTSVITVTESDQDLTESPSNRENMIFQEMITEIPTTCILCLRLFATTAALNQHSKTCSGFLSTADLPATSASKVSKRPSAFSRQSGMSKKQKKCSYN